MDIPKKDDSILVTDEMAKNKGVTIRILVNNIRGKILKAGGKPVSQKRNLICNGEEGTRVWHK